MGFQTYSDNAPMQLPMLKLKHYSTFSWKEGTIEERRFTKEEVLSLQVIEASAGLTLSISFADKIADAHIYRRTEENADRSIFLRDAAVDESEAGMRSKSKLACGWCELDPSVSIMNSERSWANLSALLKHQHSGFHAPKPRNVYDTIHSHVAEQHLTIEKTGGHHETSDTVSQRPVESKNTDVSSDGGSEDGTDKRTLKSPKRSRNDDTWCTCFRDPGYSNELERPTFSFSEVITDRYMEKNQKPRGNKEECTRAVPPSFASSEWLEEVPSDHNFLSSTGQGIKIPYPIHELNETSIEDSAPRSTTGKFFEPQPNLINFEDTTSETRSTEDWQDPWMLFREAGGALLDSL
ncbi:uncharacterized protein Bfra_005413 [Botrytis fragariae]|uniref:Uncharacterized protein n=1 Tax=Botrytis fragariae TaxID=1964551 RepID=A0A8H6EIY5_9HELO|nr:uncharacterized protein Bfra_005413 [Botrytis fragariae]KAF5873946.1 hypothetical protein Bfra_005413 [Botrytis fragariae]